MAKKEAGIKMKAIADFRGREGEGSGDKNRMVEAGDVFTVRDAGRAEYLQKRELAVMEGKSAPEKLKNKAEPGADANKEADAGNGSANPSGGQINGDNFASLSAPDRQPAKKATTGKKPSAARKRR